jgi:hypothetical protein
MNSFKTFRFIAVALAIVLVLFSCQQNPTDQNTANTPPEKTQLFAHYGTPTLDGSAADDIWEQIEWAPMNQIWKGQPANAKDFEGKYKLAWDENNLYIVAEITDDSLADAHPDGLNHFWDDDALVIFLDQDASGGPHAASHNAFAYHVALDGRVADFLSDSAYQFFDQHCVCRRTTREGISVWEVALQVHDGDRYTPDGENIPKMLTQNKKMGLALAYIDFDGRGFEPDNVFGNLPIGNQDPQVAWKNADAFGILVLQ